MTARRTALICALVNSAVAVQNPFGFLKTGPHAAHQVAIAEESTADSKIDSLATTSRNAAKHARNKHGETHASMKNHARDADEEAEIMAIQKKKEELTNRVAETHDSANQEHAELGAPCSGDPIVCKTMCRWLKMSNKDTNENCKLFEWQLRSCNYTAIEERPAGSSTDPMDCAVNFLRTAFWKKRYQDMFRHLTLALRVSPQQSMKLAMWHWAYFEVRFVIGKQRMSCGWMPRLWARI